MLVRGISSVVRGIIIHNVRGIIIHNVIFNFFLEKPNEGKFSLNVLNERELPKVHFFLPYFSEGDTVD